MEKLLQLCEQHRASFIRESEDINTGYENYEAIVTLVKMGEIKNVEDLKQYGIGV